MIYKLLLLLLVINLLTRLVIIIILFLNINYKLTIYVGRLFDSS